MPEEKIIESTGNVFLDLGFPEKEAAALAMRADLMVRLRLLIEERKWTQSETAGNLAVNPSRAGELMRGEIDRLSLDLLLDLAARVGLQTGEGEIEQTFLVTGRGKVLALKNGWAGVIPSNGLVSNERGRSPYVGPDYMNKVSERSNWTCVCITDPEAQASFHAGDNVKFYAMA